MTFTNIKTVQKSKICCIRLFFGGVCYREKWFIYRAGMENLMTPVQWWGEEGIGKVF